VKIKYIDGEGWDWLKTYSCKIYRSRLPYIGTISVIDNTNVHYPLTVDYERSSKQVFDSGYKCVTFVPDDGFWAVNAVYDTKDMIVEWYFDVLKSKSKDQKGRLYYHDLYLDVVVQPDFKSIVIDEDELEAALSGQIISLADFDFAYQVADELMNQVVRDKGFMVDFLKRQLAV